MADPENTQVNAALEGSKAIQEHGVRTSQEKAVLFTDAVAAKKESRSIDFKSTFNPAQTADWCELLKDVFAFANSGGGVIVVGVDGQGDPMASEVTAVLSLDPADMGE